MVKIKNHGNGFLRVDLSDNTMVHIYHLNIPRQKTYTGIHDHRFGFTSVVRCGQLRQSKYVAVRVPNGLYQIWSPDLSDKLVLVDSGPFRLIVVEDRLIRTGEEYTILPGEIHEIRPLGMVVTTITKQDVLESYSPRIFVKIGETPDNNFDNREKELNDE